MTWAYCPQPGCPAHGRVIFTTLLVCSICGGEMTLTIKVKPVGEIDG